MSELHAIPPWGAIVVTVGSAIMAGLLFTFSNFVMRALSQTAPTIGMEAMQRITVTILNPVFLLILVGTALLSVGIAVVILALEASPAQGWVFAGATLYLIGVLGVTAVFNVQINNALAKVPPETPSESNCII